MVNIRHGKVPTLPSNIHTYSGKGVVGEGLQVAGALRLLILLIQAPGWDEVDDRAGERRRRLGHEARRRLDGVELALCVYGYKRHEWKSNAVGLS